MAPLGQFEELALLRRATEVGAGLVEAHRRLRTSDVHAEVPAAVGEGGGLELRG